MKVLISSRSFGKINENAVDFLRNEGIEPILNPYNRKLNENELLSLIKEDVVGIIAGTEKISKRILLKNKNLKVISRYGIGLDNVDLKTADEKGILVFNTPDSPSIAVAELTLTLILNLLKKINIVNNKLKKNKWKPELGNLLSKKMVGIIGLGRIGKKLVEYLQAFNVKILYSEIKPDYDFANKYNLELTDLNNLLSKSDIITLHLPLNQKTRHLIGKKELNLIKDSALLINTARGGLVDEKILYEFLLNKKIAGAAIDVFENEPDVGKLKELENIIITPHIATYTIETRKNMEIEAAENVIKGLKQVKLL